MTKILVTALWLAAAVMLIAPVRAAAPEPATPQPQAGTEVDNPVRTVSEMMKKAGELLDKLETGEPTQEEQKKILAELDRLIELAQKSSKSSSQQQQQQQQQGQQPQPGQPQNSTNPSSQPAQNERDVIRSVRIAPGDEPPNLNEIWGKLPDAPRDEILQLLHENLPQKYKQLVIEYLKALSEKK